MKHILLLIFFTQSIISTSLKAQTTKQKATYTGHKGYFTDLTKFGSSLICVFREGKTHFSKDGKIVVIRLIEDNDCQWNRIATIAIPGFDLRDPKIIQKSNHKLMLLATGRDTEFEIKDNSGVNRYQSFAWESDDGLIWKYKGKIAEQDLWLWSLHENETGIYSISYSVGKKDSTEQWKLKLHKFGKDKFDILSELKHPLLEKNLQPSETAITTLPSGEMIIVVRRKRGINSVMGISKPPYTNWNFSELPISIEGQALITIKDKTILAGRELKNKKKYMTIMDLQVDESMVQSEIRIRPARGDFAYPGLEVFNNHLCMSYYKNGKIYFISTKTPLDN